MPIVFRAFAPRPVWRQGVGQTLRLKTYASGVGLSHDATNTMAFSGIDGNVWTAQALDAIDSLLGAPFAPAMRVVDRLTGGDILQRMLAHKASLAQTISRSVTWVVEDPHGPPSDTALAAAQDDYLQALRRSLGVAFSRLATAGPGPVVPRGEQGDVRMTLPAAPHAVVQTATPARATAARPHPTPAELARWDYTLDFLLDQSAGQDVLHATIELNRPMGVQPRGGTDERGPGALFRPLAQLITVLPELQADCARYLSHIGGWSRSRDEDVVHARIALDAFATLVDEFATAYREWVAAGDVAAPAPPPDPMTYSFAVRLSDAAGVARIDVLPVAGAVRPAGLPDPVVEFDPEQYVARVTPQPGPGAIVSYQYVRTGSHAVLRYADAPAVSRRVLRFDDLSAVAFRNARARIRVTRNEQLVAGRRTNPLFALRTAETGPPDPIAPLLTRMDYDLNWSGECETLLEYLDAFFTSLLSGASGDDFAIQLGVAYSWRAVLPRGEGPRTRVPIALWPPVPLPGRYPALLRSAAETVTGWLATNQPPRDVGSRVEFHLTVFPAEGAGPGNVPPLLIVRRLYVDVSAVTDLEW